ncbi:MAG TPA: hypothetical protein VGN69_08145 [Solirubrobacteraceae bacterium]|jgi:hypothetical protein|nr:hypothetical protein [Solirubrobacteraceae bacterium]
MSLRRRRSAPDHRFALGQRGVWRARCALLAAACATGVVGAGGVDGLGSAARGAPAAGTGRSAGAKVTIMVVGSRATLLGPTAVTARRATVRVRGRRCAIAPDTPLAALLEARRAGAPSPLLRDYGHCSRQTRDAAALFVYALGPDHNRARDGWVYKVGHRLGTTGAADPSGPRGDGHRLGSGERVLWFWCQEPPAGGCQRTLEVSPEQRTLGAGQQLAVRVTGFDDHGRGAPVAGATVTLGSASASTGADGVARVTAAGSGPQALNALAAGTIAAFPVVVRVT